MKNLNNAIYEIIGYRFKDNALLEEALTHPSVNKRDSEGKTVSYERLEFLGDSVLDVTVSTMLFRLFSKEKEGALAKRKTDLVCGSTIANIAKEIKLDSFIIMNNSERCNGGEHNLKNLENALEALIGAIYLDGGFQSAEEFVNKYWGELAKKMLNPPQDSKTSLQEWTQKNKLPLPKYKTVGQDGPAHKPEFTMSVYIENYDEVFASAYSKKIAEQKAAELMIKKINCEKEENNKV